MCIQTGPIGLPQVAMLGKKFPKVNIILDHLARPEVPEGPPYPSSASLFELGSLPNIYMKLTPRIFGDIKKGKASAETFFPRVVEAFGARRMAWGSNFPTSPGTLKEILATAQAGLACLSESDRSWIFGGTAKLLYPKLA
jgi:predicted TIM-barrel fold metal-dependent hydrolase